MAFDLRQGIMETAQALGMDPVDLATLIHYESGLNPDVWGGAGGRHYGAIQFGPAEREQYGVQVGNPESQFGANGAIVKYMLGRGFKPGMGILDAYSTINAGSPGRYNASDAGNGGQPGNVRDKVTEQMADDRVKAQAFLGTASNTGPSDPRDDTPSYGKPIGSELPGPTSPYKLQAGHPPNPTVGAPGPNPLMTPPVAVKNVDDKDKYQKGFSSAVAGLAGNSAPTMKNLPQMPGQAPMPMGAMPIVAGGAGGGMGRDQFAALMLQLNSGKLWG